MRKQIFKVTALLLVAASLIFTSACNKESRRFKESSNQDENRKNVMVNAKLVNEFTIEDMQTYTQATQHLIFAEMTVENKARLVKERIDYEINFLTDQTKITKLNQLKSLVNSSLYIENPDSTNAQNIESFIEQDMIPLFGYEWTRRITNSWGNVGTELATGWSPNDCSCSKKSDWCSGIGDCAGGGCNEGNGCGSLFMYKCNGECTLGVINFNYPASWPL